MSSKIILTSTGIGMALGGLSGGYIGWTIQRQKNQSCQKIQAKRQPADIAFLYQNKARTTAEKTQA